MTEQQFDALVKLMRGDPDTPGNRAARLVLVSGQSQAEAVRETGASRSNVSLTVSRYADAHRLIRRAYQEI